MPVTASSRAPIIKQHSDDVSAGHWEFFASTGKLYWSDEVYKIHGLEVGGEIDIAAGIAAYHPEDQEKVSECIRLALEEKQNFQFDLRIVRPDGTWRNVRSIGFVKLDPDGEVGSVFGIFQDITKFVVSDTELERQKTLFEAVFRESIDAIILADINRIIVMANPAVTRIYGYEPNEIIGKSAKLFYPSDEEFKKQGKVRFHSESGRIGEPYEVYYKRKDGKIILSESVGTPFSDANGQVQGYIVVSRDITERKKVEEVINESERRFRHAFENAPTGIALITPDGVRIEVNKALASFLGYSPEELMGTEMKSTAADMDALDESMRLRQKVLDGEIEVYRNERRYRHKDGHIVWGEVTGSLYRNEKGEPQHFIAHTLDITERKRLEEQHSQLFTAIDALAESVVLFDAEDRFVFSNKTFRSHNIPVLDSLEFGKTYEEYLRAAINQGLMLSAIGREEEWLQERLERHRNPTGPIEVERQDGMWLLVHEQRLENGGLVLLSTTITEQKRAEEAETRAAARLRDILEIAPEAVFTISDDKKIQLFNHGAERIFGYTAEEVRGRHFDFLMPDRFRHNHVHYVSEFEDSGDTYRLMDSRGEIVGLRKDGSEFPATASVSSLEAGGDRMFTVMMQDVSARRKAENERRVALLEAEKANRAKSEFLASMSHELRTPLNAILGFADIIRHQYLGDIGQEKYLEYANDIHSSGDHLLSLINDILDLSAIEAGKRSLNIEGLNIADVIEETVSIVGELASHKQIKLVTDASNDLPTLHADKRAIRQILLNLISNALKFTPENGVVTVSAELSARKINMKVTDTGCGISSDDLLKLVNPFTRIEQNPHLATEGTGLGLSITKSLVELHEGKMEIESDIGNGTAVTISLPLLQHCYDEQS